ncbi:SDR family oxidoreductase [Patescibacteria group bacterium]|nr:SDR family oxidoreductase [Patescibacteria group bacterium]
MTKILIIGAGSKSKNNPSIKGIGTCLVELLAKKDNISILFTYNQSKKEAEELKNSLLSENNNLKIETIKFNSLNYKTEWRNLESELRKFGTPDIFIYNAGVRFYKKNLTNSEKEMTMNVNYLCPIYLIKKIGQKMAKEAGKGKIIITSSIWAGKHHPFLEEYCTTKGLLNKYVNDHKEYWIKKGINISIISPDVTISPMTEERVEYYENLIKEGKMEKLSSAEEVAESIIKLCF